MTLGPWNKQPQFSGAKSAMALHSHSLKRAGPTYPQALKAPLGTSPVPSPWELPEKAGKSLLASGRGRSGSSESPGTGVEKQKGPLGRFLSAPLSKGGPRAPIHRLLGSRKTLTLQTCPFSSLHPPPITKATFPGLRSRATEPQGLGPGTCAARLLPSAESPPAQVLQSFRPADSSPQAPRTRPRPRSPRT